MSDNLVALWHFEGDYLDSSGNNYDLTCSSCPTTTTGIMDTIGMIFDGTQKLSTTQTMDLSNNYTISFWVKPTSIPVNGAPLGGGTANYALLVHMYTNTYNLIFLTGNGTSSWGTYPTVYNTSALNRWQHIVVMSEGSTKRLYLNGKLMTTTTNPYAFNNIINLGMGYGTSYPFFGEMDEVAIWNRAFSTEEVENLYKRQTSYLDLEVYSCSDSLCETKLDTKTISKVNNNELIDTSSLAVGRYFGLDVNFKFFDYFDMLGSPAFLKNISLVTSTANIAPQGNFLTVNGNSHTSLPVFSAAEDGNLDIGFEVFDLTNDRLTVDIGYYSLSNPSQITLLANDVNLSLANCDSQDWVDSYTNCNIDVNISNVPSGQYILRIDLNDAVNLIPHLDSSDLATIDANGPTLSLIKSSSWQRNNVGINISCSDNFSDCNSSTIRYKIDNGNWTNYNSFVKLEGDGNYLISLEAYDTKNNYSNITTSYLLVGYNGQLKTYNDLNQPESFFNQGEKIKFIYDVNLNIAPTIIIKDSSGAVKANQTMTNITNDPNFGSTDLNVYYYEFDVNGANGYFDVNIQNQKFEDNFYKSNIWQTKFLDDTNHQYIFAIDFNVVEPGVMQRWFYPVNTNISLGFGANPNTIRVLDYNTTNYSEVPSQIISATTVNGFVTDFNLVFLSSLDVNQEKQYVLVFSTVGSAASYQTDKTVNNSNNKIIISNSEFSANIDINKGGAVISSKSFIGTSQDFNSLSVQQQALSVTSDSQYSINNITSPTYVLTTGPLYTNLLVSGSKSLGPVTLYDYNLEYIFYAKSNNFIVNQKIMAKSPALWVEYFDDYQYFNNDQFKKYFSYNTTLNLNPLANDNSSNAYNSNSMFGLYNKETLDAYGQILIDFNSSQTALKRLEFLDLTNYFVIKHNVDTYQNVVNGDYYTSNYINAFFNPMNEYQDLNQIKINHENPVITNIGTVVSNDSANPTITNLGSYLVDSNNPSTSDINCFAHITDDTIIDNVILNVSGPNVDYNYSSSILLSDTNLIVQIDKNVLNAGDINCTFYAYDIASNITSNYTQFNYSDFVAPNIVGISTSPDGNNDIDPNTDLVFDVNINEYTAMSNALIYYRKQIDSNTWQSWTSLNLINDLNYSDWNYHYTNDLNVTEGTYEYYVYAIDSLGNDVNSQTNTIYAYLDYTWTYQTNIAQNALGFVGSPDPTELGSITITNTGDVNLSFLVTTNWPDPNDVLFNNVPEGYEGYSLTLKPGISTTLSTAIFPRSNEGTTELTILIDGITTGSNPDTNTLNLTFVSLSDGPFMLISWVVNSDTVVQKQTDVNYSVKLTNFGNAIATDTNFIWNYPSDWTLNSGAPSVSIPGNFAIRSSVTSTLTFSIPADANLGDQTISFTANCCGTVDKTRSSSKTVTVLLQESSSGGGGGSGGSTTIIETAGSETGGSGGGGGSTGGSNGSIFTKEQQDLFFQTNEFFEIIRGKDDKFSIKFTNPLSGNLSNVKLSVNGLISKYLQLQDTRIVSLAPNETFNTIISIVSPKYFSPGEYELTFNIEGEFNDEYDRLTSFAEERKVILIIHDVSEMEAQEFINDLNFFITDLNDGTYNLTELIDLQKKATRLLAQRDFDGVKAKFIESQSIYDSAKLAEIKKSSVVGLIGWANSKGIETPETDRALFLAQLAFSRGDYALALARLKEAELIYSIETKGEFNLFIWALANLDRVLLMIILLSIAGYMFNKGSRLFLINRKLSNLDSEDKLLLTLIEGLQKRCFIENKISLGEYSDALEQFELRISVISEDIIEYNSKKHNVLNFSSTSVRLATEKEELLNLLRSTQRQYFELGLVETRIYRTKVKSLTKRLSEVEEMIVSQELLKTQRLNKRFKKHFWRFFYSIKK
jgi:hypothetical protein